MCHFVPDVHSKKRSLPSRLRVKLAKFQDYWLLLCVPASTGENGVLSGTRAIKKWGLPSAKITDENIYDTTNVELCIIPAHRSFFRLKVEH